MNKSLKKYDIYVEVALPVPAFLSPLSYHYSGDLDLKVGARVKVPIGKRELVGVVLSVSDQSQLAPQKIKEVIAVLDQEAVVSAQQIALSLFVAHYYHVAIGEVLKLCLPAGEQKTEKTAKKIAPEPTKAALPVQQPFELTADQQEAVQKIMAGDKRAFLLHGITGSGKTEIYVQIAQQILARGQSVLLIVPEIALSPNLYNYLSARLEQNIVMLHSGLSPAKRRDAFFDLLNKKARIAIGARSALFAPLPDLGLIVVDEEHDSSLKQESTPRYHGRDVALWRAQNEKAIIILGSATPSLESKHNVHLGKLQEIRLNNRASKAAVLPNIRVIDLKQRKLAQSYYARDAAQTQGQSLCILSDPLRDAIDETLQKGEQTMLFLNRRGYAAFAICRDCGEIIHCPQCSVSLTYYQNKRLLRCHQCDYVRAIPPHCPACTEGEIIFLGLGTERVEQEVKAAFPEARVARLDRSTTSSFKELQKLLNEMKSGTIDILIGTQMIAKGHDFPSVSLVGVILADTGMGMPDFRANEKTFQLLTQVAGRSGRSKDGGQVIFQTLNPGHLAIQCAQNHDVDTFITSEMASRKAEFQPPFCRSALLRIEGTQSAQIQEVAQNIKNELLAFCSKEKHTLDILGPAEAPLAQLKKKYRYHLYLRALTHQTRASALNFLQYHEKLQKYVRSQGCQLVIDVDPQNMM